MEVYLRLLSGERHSLVCDISQAVGAVYDPIGCCIEYFVKAYSVRVPTSARKVEELCNSRLKMNQSKQYLAAKFSVRSWSRQVAASQS